MIPCHWCKHSTHYCKPLFVVINDLIIICCRTCYGIHLDDKEYIQVDPRH